MSNSTVTFSDVFKDKFLSGFSLATQNLTLPNILISLAIAFALGLLIYFIYKKTYRGVLYSHSFNISLIMLCMVTTLIIMCISSAPALSLGMVGALSIVRFRTAVKDPMDTVYMFWAISVGITVGANFILFSIIGTLVIAGHTAARKLFAFTDMPLTAMSSACSTAAICGMRCSYLVVLFCAGSSICPSIWPTMVMQCTVPRAVCAVMEPVSAMLLRSGAGTAVISSAMDTLLSVCG